MIENMEGAKELIVKKAVEHANQCKVEFNEKRIKELQEELELLKK